MSRSKKCSNITLLVFSTLGGMKCARGWHLCFVQREQGQIQSLDVHFVKKLEDKKKEVAVATIVKEAAILF